MGALGELWGGLGSWGVKFLKKSSCIVLSKMVNFSLCTLPENGESWSSGRPLGALGVVWELWRSSGRENLDLSIENL